MSFLNGIFGRIGSFDPASDQELVSELDETGDAYQTLAAQQGRFRKRLTKRDMAQPGLGTIEASQVPGIETLRAAVARVDSHMDQVFAQARNTFDAYGPAESQPLAIQALRVALWSRQAETLYSFGRRRAGRRLWLAISNEDRLDPNPLHNIAVCDTVEGDRDRALASWQAYAEAEYFQAVALGSPRNGAQSRASLHGEFVAALGLVALRAEEPPHMAKAEDGRLECKKLLSQARVNSAVKGAEKNPERTFEALVSELRSGVMESDNLPTTAVDVAVMMAMKTRRWDKYSELWSALQRWHYVRKSPRSEPEQENPTRHSAEARQVRKLRRGGGKGPIWWSNLVGLRQRVWN